MSETTTETPVEGQELPPETPPVDQTQPPPTPETPPEGEKPAKSEEDWREKRIRQLTARNHAEIERVAALEKQIADLRKAQQQPAADPDFVPRSELDRRAAELAEQRRFNDACNATAAQGRAKFGDFQDAVGGFELIGGASRELLDAVTSLDNGADVYYALGKNPGEAQRLMSLSPTRMAVELAKMEAKLSAPAPAAAPKPVSRAPAPIAPIDRGATEGDVNLYDDSDDARWYAARQKQVAARGKR